MADIDGKVGQMKNIFIYSTAIGRIGIAEKDEHITNIFFEGELPGIDLPVTKDTGPVTFRGEEYAVRETGLIKEALQQLEEYFSGRRKSFSLPLAPQGTDFMKNVWQCLCAIPFGETRSYREIAAAAGNPKASRAVGLANNRNPIPLIIPCHRVIGSNGKLTGYRGGLETKQQLLEIEQKHADI